MSRSTQQLCIVGFFKLLFAFLLAQTSCPLLLLTQDIFDFCTHAIGRNVYLEVIFPSVCRAIDFTVGDC